MANTYKIKNITVRQKIATGDDTYIVCGNSDYTVHWDLDDEWAEYAEKTMLVVLDSGEAYSIQFTGTEAALPALPSTRRCVIGLMAGDVRTTTGAMFACRPSIRDASGTPVEPPADVYAQLVSQLARKISEPSQDGTAGQALVTDGKGGRSWATVQGGGSADAILYTEQELTDEQQAQARANIDAISSADVPAKLPNPQPLEIIYADAAEAHYPGRVTYDGSSPQSIDIRSNFTEWRSTMPGYIKNNPFAGSGKTYLPTWANWTNEFSQSSTLNFEINGTRYYNVEGVRDGPMYMLKFTCGDYTIHLNRMNTTFSISPVLSDNKWYLLKIGALPQINMEAEPESDMQIATKKYVDNHAAASGKDGITPTIGETMDLSWKHIRDVELAPDAIEAIVSTTDAGNTFSYDEIMLEFIPNLEGYFYVRASQNANLSKNVSVWVTNSKYSQVHLGLLNKKLAITSAFRTDGSLSFSNNYGGNGDIDKISTIVFGASSSVGAAFTVKIWGR